MCKTALNLRNIANAMSDETDGISEPDYIGQDFIDLTRQAIATAQPQALDRDTMIIFDVKPRVAMAITDGKEYLRSMGILFADAITKAPWGSAISISVLMRGLQVMIALEHHGDGIDKHTIDLVAADFDQVTWPDTPDPTDVTIPSSKTRINQTYLHIRKLASADESGSARDTGSATRVVLAYPRITLS